MSVQDKPGKKFVFVNRYYDPDQSATSQLLTDLARGLTLSSRTVHVVTSRQLYGEPGSRLAAVEMLGGVKIHRIAATRFGRKHLFGRAVDYASFYLTCAIRLLTLLRRGDVLIAKTDPPLLSILAAAIAGLRGVALINWQQDLFPEVASYLGANPLPAWLNRYLTRLRDASLRVASMNVLIGARMREYLLARGVPSSKLEVIENWSNGAVIKPKAASTSTLRRRLGLKNQFVVCYSGNLGRAHEFDTLLAAAEHLKEEPVFTFLIIGSGAKMEALRKAVSQRALDSFHFLPYQPRDALEDSLAAADIHLVSLLPVLEGFIVPSKLYGILASGRPLIFIGDTDGDTGRIIQRAQCGVCVAVGDSQGLTNRLRKIAADPVGREAMGARARQLFCDEFSLERAISRWVAVLDAAQHH